jgi:hypothetical protein
MYPLRLNSASISFVITTVFYAIVVVVVNAIVIAIVFVIVIVIAIVIVVVAVAIVFVVVIFTIVKIVFTIIVVVVVVVIVVIIVVNIVFTAIIVFAAVVIINKISISIFSEKAAVSVVATAAASGPFAAARVALRTGLNAAEVESQSGHLCLMRPNHAIAHMNAPQVSALVDRIGIKILKRNTADTARLKTVLASFLFLEIKVQPKPCLRGCPIT